MDEAAIKKSLSDITETITSFPVGGQRVAGGIYESDAQPSAAGMEESIDYLRLQIKYLLFDLEATRRENRYLRQLLENRHKPDREGGGEF
jgi:hypothetical protein